MSTYDHQPGLKKPPIKKLRAIATDLCELSLAFSEDEHIAIIGFVCTAEDQVGFFAPFTCDHAMSVMLQIISSNKNFDILEKATLETLAKKLKD